MKSIVQASLLLLLLRVSWAAEDVVTAVHGTVAELDSATKTMVVKTKDGTEHTFHFVGKTSVHGVKPLSMKQPWAPKTPSTDSRKAPK